jgi:hypothetical protein
MTHHTGSGPSDPDRPGWPRDTGGTGSDAGLTRMEDELRGVQARIDGVRGRMRAATDVFGLLGFGLAFAGLLVVAGLASVSFASGETGVGMLFAALTLVALPIVGVAAWHAFGRMWALGRELTVLRRREAAIFDELATVYEPADAASVLAGAGVAADSESTGWFSRSRRDITEDLPPGNSPDGFQPVPKPGAASSLRGGIALWLLVAVGILLLLFVLGVALGTTVKTT